MFTCPGSIDLLNRRIVWEYDGGKKKHGRGRYDFADINYRDPAYRISDSITLRAYIRFMRPPKSLWIHMRVPIIRPDGSNAHQWALIGLPDGTTPEEAHAVVIAKLMMNEDRKEGYE